MDGAVQGYCRLGIAPSTRKTYESAFRRFGSFCSKYSIINPFPVDESILCYFVAFLAKDGLAPQSIKSYLAAIHHTQIEAGLPEPKSLSSCPQLKLILNGVARQRIGHSSPKKPCLPILADTLLGLFRTMVWKVDRDMVMVWAACSISFFGFLQAEEITVPTCSAFQPHIHLTWEDVSVDSVEKPKILRVHLKVSKCDQFGNSIDIFLGRIESPMSPVAATLSYMVIRGPAPGPFFQFQDGNPLTKSHLSQLSKIYWPKWV